MKRKFFPVCLKTALAAVEMKDDGDDMTIYFSIPEHDAVSEMVLVSDSEMSVILLSGDMPLSELAFIAAGTSGY